MELFKSINNENSNLALMDESGLRLTYSDLFRERAIIGTFFRKRSIVLFLTNNTIDSILIYLSLLEIASVPILVDYSISHEFLERLIENYTPDYVVSPKSVKFKHDSFFYQRSTNDFNVFENSNLIGPLNIINAKLALLLTTSGTTGSPKLVRITYDNIFANTESICQYLNLDISDRALTTLPMNYSFGLSVINTHLFAGGSIFVTSRSIIEKEFWNLMVENRITFFSGVPFTYEVLERIKFRTKELPDLRILVQAGGKLSSNLIEVIAKNCLEKKRKFFVMYGQTEATARMSYLPYEKCLTKLGSIGIAIPKGEFLLITEEGTVITETHKIGELVYLGPNVSMGYAETRADLNLGDTNYGKLNTGDLAFRDEDGYFYIVGRKKRFIKIFGIRTNLDEIEQILKSNSIDCACVGSDDNLQVYVTDKNIEDSELKKLLASKLRVHASVISINYIKQIPVNSSGKVNYQLLT